MLRRLQRPLRRPGVSSFDARIRIAGARTVLTSPAALPAKDGDAPKPLDKPIGVKTPPTAGQNTGIDTRSWRERRDDFVNYDKHLEKRRILTEKVATPYFREWTSMKHYEGKTFLSPAALFKASRALYFPNLSGRTLATADAVDVTPTLESKISVLSLFSSTWAERQVETFLSARQNAQLVKVLTEAGPQAQVVHLNVEEDNLKYALLKLFLGSLRRRFSRKDWGKYFIIRKGLTGELRQAIGAINGKVGYVYLLDEDCRIRWAGCGPAQDEERASLVRGLQKLLKDSKLPPSNSQHKLQA